MTDHDALAALLRDHAERAWPAQLAAIENGGGWNRWDHAAHFLEAAGVRVTGDAGLREAARLALAAFDAENVAALGTDQDAAEEAALDTVDAMEVLRAAVAGDASEAHPVGDAADTAASDLRSSAGWLVERWDGNRTVQPDALRADIAVLRDALRNPQALSTLESSQPTALRLLAEHAIECPDLDYDDEAAVVAAARAALAALAPDTGRPEACEFVPAHEPWSCRVHHGIRPRLDVTVCSRIVPARLESEDAAAHLAWPFSPDQPHPVVAVCDGCGTNVTLDDKGDWTHVALEAKP